jgi:hypothetical protein
MAVLAARSLVFAIALVASSAHAAVIRYQVTNVAGTTWRYDYTVVNDGSPAGNIRLFDIDFDPALYDEASLAIVSGASITASWDEMFLASGLNVPAAYDVLATGSGIANGQSVSGFAVSFTWLGAGTPGAQAFQIYDASTFALLGTGTTTAVPAPAASWLLATALSVAAFRIRRRHA